MQQVNQFVDHLLTENEKFNLTAVRNKEDAYMRHVQDSFALLEALKAHVSEVEPTSGAEKEGCIHSVRLIDVGSGPGLPGILLAIAQPEWQVWFSCPSCTWLFGPSC